MDINPNRVVVAMSGGVDSSVAAALLKERGMEVIGISMQLWDYSEREDKDGATRGGCCSLDDIHDARRVADTIGIPHYVVNMEEVFSKEVVGYFVDAYLSGNTPNPCIKCNEVMKFEALMRKAVSLGAAKLATGHYARIEKNADGKGLRLLRGRDPKKDQSYFLFTMTQRHLGNVLFPAGELTKDEVREAARRFNLRVAEKDESQEICFVDDKDGYAAFVAERAGAAALTQGGDMVDSSGRRVGAHSGLFRYTIGQRRGLDIKDGAGPYYVTGMDRKNNTLIVGPEEELLSTGLTAYAMNWINTPPSPDETVMAAIRYRHRGAEAAVELLSGGRAAVRFKSPEKAVTPGQAVVIYRGDEVLGGGWIEGAAK